MPPTSTAEVEVDAGVSLGSPGQPPERGGESSDAQRRHRARSRGPAASALGEAEVGEEAPASRDPARSSASWSPSRSATARTRAQDDRGAADEGEHEGHDPQPRGHRGEGGVGLVAAACRCRRTSRSRRRVAVATRVPTSLERCARLGGDEHAGRRTARPRRRRSHANAGVRKLGSMSDVATGHVAGGADDADDVEGPARPLGLASSLRTGHLVVGERGDRERIADADAEGAAVRSPRAISSGAVGSGAGPSTTRGALVRRRARGRRPGRPWGRSGSSRSAAGTPRTSGSRSPPRRRRSARRAAGPADAVVGA